MEDFFLDIVYKNKMVRFRVVNPEAPLSTLMTNLTHAIGVRESVVQTRPCSTTACRVATKFS